MRIALISLVLLAACMSEPDRTTETITANCGADALQDRVGQPAADHDFDTGDRPVRILPPGSIMTMDHRPDRLNVETDDAGIITRIWCG